METELINVELLNKKKIPSLVFLGVHARPRIAKSWEKYERAIVSHRDLNIHGKGGGGLPRDCVRPVLRRGFIFMKSLKSFGGHYAILIRHASFYERERERERWEGKKIQRKGLGRFCH